MYNVNNTGTEKVSIMK